MRAAHILFGKIILTTVVQGTGAPMIDPCGGRTIDDKRWRGYAVLLAPWRRDQYGDRRSGLAICFGWMEAQS